MFKFKAWTGPRLIFCLIFLSLFIIVMSNMKFFKISILLIALSSITSFAQNTARVTSGVDFGVGYQDKVWVPSVMYHQELGMANFPWFRIGWGVRTWGYYAGEKNLYPSGKSFSNDYLKYSKVTSNGLSVLFGANFRLGSFDIGANTDLAGIAIGAKRNGLYSKDYIIEDDGGYYKKLIRSKPSFINALPAVLDDQNGQSELYLRYWITTTIGVKVACVIGRTTYTTTEKLENGENRFSKNYAVPSVSVSFPLYN